MLNEKFDSDLFDPLDSDEFLPPIGRWTNWTGILLVGLLGAAIALAASIKYNVAVKASGIVRPAGEFRSLAAATQGTIKEVQVSENQLVKAGDAIAQIDATPLERQKAQLANSIQRLNAELSQIKAQVNQFGANNKNTTISKNRNAVNSPAGSLLIQRSQQVEDQLNRIQKDLDQVNRMIANRIIRTPTTGMISKLELGNVGQPVKLGQEVAQIVPTNGSMVIKSRVTVQDIGQVEVGQSAQLRVSAYPYPDYGILQGKVKAIAADTSETNNSDPSSAYYEVTIQPERTYLVRRNQEYSIQPGMEVTANIISREETLLTFLVRKTRLMADF